MNIGVCGMGRFGAFWAEQLSRQYPVFGWNRSQRNPYPASVFPATLEKVLSCEVVVLCVSISSFEDVVASIAPKIKPGTLVMDTCSVKVHPARIMEHYFPSDIELIATHPMFGPDSGKNGIAGLPLVWWPLRCSEGNAKRWDAIFTGMGLHVLQMDCDTHDREAAWSQGVTHFIGRVLDALHLHPTELATVGYQRLLSIVEQTCNDPIQLFYDLQRYNPYTRDMHQQLKRALDSMLGVLERGNDSSRGR